MIALDEGAPPTAEIRRRAELPRRDNPQPAQGCRPRTILGRDQKAWFKDQLQRSTATWKIWGNSLGASTTGSIRRIFRPAWSRSNGRPNTFAQSAQRRLGAPTIERGEIYDLVRDAKITGFGIVSGDRHSFWAGYAAASCRRTSIEPVGVSFVGGSLVSPGRWKVLSTGFKKAGPCARYILRDRPDGTMRGPITCF
jgi:alkaline phosphatase D